MKTFFFALLLLLAPALQAQTTIFLVRHAEKVDSSRDPELSLAGKARAVRLKELLAEVGIEKVYSTDYIRTRETARPLVELMDLSIEFYRPFEAEMVETLKSDLDGKKVLVVGHSNTIPDLVNQLIGEKQYDQLEDSQYSYLFVVTLMEGQATHYVLTF